MINYELLHKSIVYYEEKGFTRVESPWTVSEKISELTKPKQATPYKLYHNNKCLVGSAEQSFLYLYNKGFLPKGKFQSCTPCFRDEEFSETHTKYFMKNELIITDEVTVENFLWMVNTCKIFFDILFGEEINIVKTDIGMDLMFRDIEIGSYGFRHFPFLSYIYGTGCAEPRITYCLNLQKIKR